MARLCSLLEKMAISYSQTKGGLLIHRDNVTYDLREQLNAIGAKVYHCDTLSYLYL